MHINISLDKSLDFKNQTEYNLLNQLSKIKGEQNG